MRRARRFAAALLAAWLGAAAPAVVAQPPDPPASTGPQALRLPADAAPLRVDGRLDEAAWSEAPAHEAFTQFLPLDRQPPPAGYRTRLQIVIEPHALVFGLRAWDPQPQQIRAPLVRRDQVKRDQDFVAILLDPVGTRRAAQFFRVNAAGTVADGMYIADTDSEDFAPDFEFEAAVARLDDGYSVELRLPLLSLRYPYAGGAPWRVMALRSIPRDASTLLLSAPLTKDSLSFIAELQTIAGLEDLVERVRSDALLSIRPELTLRSTRTREGNADAPWHGMASLGAEIKWRPRADWVFDATLNPDFSQVELDAPQLAGNTRFALSEPEKRPFFLESTDVLDLPLQAFYSRSVTDPGWGLRATWRGVSADATAFSLRDDGGGTILDPGPYATTTRLQDRRSLASLLRGRWHGGELTVGGLLTRRDEDGGASNQVAGLDLSWRPGDDQQLVARAMASQSRPDPAARSESGQHLHVDWSLRLPGWNFNAKATDVSPRFRNDNGFVEQAGVRTLEAELIRRWGEVEVPQWWDFRAHEFETYLWLQHQATRADAANGIPGGETVLQSFHPGLWLAAARNTEAWLQLEFDEQRAHSGGRLHPQRALAFSYSVNPAPWFTRLLTEWTVGKLLDVEADRTGPGARGLLEVVLRGGFANGWGIESEQRLEQNFVEAPGGGRAFTDTALRWLGVLHFDARDSLRLVWQRATFVRAADASVALAALEQRTQTTSAVFMRRFGVGRSLSVGASHQSDGEQPSGARRRVSEVFAKVSFEFGR